MRFKVNQDHASQRLDNYVVERLPNLSRASVQKLITAGKVLVNTELAKTSYKLRFKDVIDVDFDPDKKDEIPEIQLPIIYEDKSCIVINKPAGVLTHSKGAFNPEATVATFIQQQSNIPISNQNRDGIVHRLDRPTSGIIIGAKSQAALSWLQKQFSERKVKKTYLAVVAGELNPSEAIIDMPIERNPVRPQTFRVGQNGKPAITEYRTLQSAADYSLIELKPLTGRTHQLRVHLKQLGHPIIGDTLYGGQVKDRLYLHALSLEITLPSKKRQVFTAPLPDEFQRLMENE